jgi:hypothetical protein
MATKVKAKVNVKPKAEEWMDGDMPFHPLADLVPPMTDDEFDDLVADIKANGQRLVIWVYKGQLLDGRHRYRACRKLGLKPRTKEWQGKEEDLPAFVYSLNFNRTYRHDPVKHRHLFRGLVYCGSCGYVLFQQINENGKRYLRHNHAAGNRRCEQPATYVPADDLEAVVMRHLFEIFGNPVAMAEAVRAGMPDQGKVGELTAKRDRALKALEKVQAQRRNLAVAIREGLPFDAYHKEQVDILAAKETVAREQFEAAAEALRDIPTPADVEARGRRIADRMGNARKAWLLREASLFDYMTWEDKKSLVELCFGSKKAPDGRPAGIYLGPGVGGRKARQWRYEVVGDLIDSEGFFAAGDGCDVVCDDEGNPLDAIGNAVDAFITGPDGRKLDRRKEILHRVAESSGSAP